MIEGSLPEAALRELTTRLEIKPRAELWVPGEEISYAP